MLHLGARSRFLVLHPAGLAHEATEELCFRRMPCQHLLGTGQDRAPKQVSRVALSLMPPVPGLAGALLPVDQLTIIVKPFVQAAPRPQDGLMCDLDDFHAGARIPA